jgi:6-phosphogluconate dehydrogenase
MKLIVHGLGRMGMQIARKLQEGGHTVIALNRSPEPVAEAVSFGAIGTLKPEEALSHFGADERVYVWLMLPSEITRDFIGEWLKILPQRSVIINGANSDYRETRIVTTEVAAAGMAPLIDVGVSGGVWGYDNGFPLMIGSDDRAAVDELAPVFETLTSPGGAYAYFGPSGSGNYVKMVHNAIEYGMMQSLGEGYQLLHESPYGALDLAAAGNVWQHHSVITSWLNDLTLQAVTENPELDGITGYVAESGETQWALDTATELGIKVPVIQAAFDVRVASQHGEVNFATKIVAAQRNKFGGHNLNGEGRA